MLTTCISHDELTPQPLEKRGYEAVDGDTIPRCINWKSWRRYEIQHQQVRLMSSSIGAAAKVTG
jgi:hypothetical protein